MIFNIFGKKPPQPPMRDVRRLTAPFTTGALQVVKHDAPTLSHFGGDANLPSSFPWPVRNAVRLSFLARLSLTELHRALPLEWLPSTGSLLFFYDLENQPWGFDPKDRGAWMVLHVPDLQAPTASNTPRDSVAPISFRPLGFKRITTWPSPERPAIAQLNLSDAELDELGTAQDDEFSRMPKHQVSGFPAPVQADAMELECQLVSNGLYCGNSKGYKDPKALTLREGAGDWKLLFQFDSDDELGIMWGDCGMIYFWVRQQDARKADFSNAWLILQCA